MKKLEFKSNNEKQIKMLFNVQEIDPYKINYKFNIHTEKVDYCFRGKMTKSGKVFFNIPPLNNIISEDLKSGEYTSSIEASTEDYRSVVWKGKVDYKASPKIKLEAAIVENDNLTENKKERKIKAVTAIETDRPINNVKKENVDATVNTTAVVPNVENLATKKVEVKQELLKPELEVDESDIKSNDEKMKEEENRDKQIIEESVHIDETLLPSWMK